MNVEKWNVEKLYLEKKYNRNIIFYRLIDDIIT